MTKLKDSVGSEWDVSLTVEGIRRCRRAGVDLGDLLSGERWLLWRLRDDITLVLDCLAAMLAADLEKQGISAEQFVGRFQPADFGAAALVFWQEVVAFMRTWRPAVVKVIEGEIVPELTGGKPLEA